MWYGMSLAILMLTNLVCLAGNMLMLPGNWIMLACLALFLWLAPTAQGPDWTVLLVVAGMAGLAEVLELLSGSATASRKGASRRAMLLSLLLSIVGSLVGALVVPIPVIGTAIGAVGGAAIGAFAGAWIGEAWIGSDPAKRHQVGTAAMVGRILGMLAKFLMGIAIMVYEVIALWP